MVVSHPDAERLQPVLETFRPLLKETDGDIPIVADLLIVADLSIVTASEPGIRARLETPNGQIDLS